MERKSYVRSTLGQKSIKDYIEQYAKQGKSEIIIPPGAYGYTGIVLEGANDITIYGYGVLAELGAAGSSDAFSFTNCSRCTVNGIFISASVYERRRSRAEETTVSKVFSVSGVSDKFNGPASAR